MNHNIFASYCNYCAENGHTVDNCNNYQRDIVLRYPHYITHLDTFLIGRYTENPNYEFPMNINRNILQLLARNHHLQVDPDYLVDTLKTLYSSLGYQARRWQELTPNPRPITSPKLAVQIIVDACPFINISETIECPVCYENAPPILTGCKHGYCIGCIQNILNNNMQCALCRENIRVIYVASEEMSDQMMMA